MLASVASATLLGVHGQVITVEVHLSNGLPGYTVVGLPDAAVRESRERVRAALLSCGLPWPLQRITVNLAPGGVPKHGPGLDLAVALGLLAANGELPDVALDGLGAVGELGLDGSVRAVPGVLARADALARAGVTRLVVPLRNAPEAELVPDLAVRPARSLGELRDCLKGEAPWPDAPPPPPADAGMRDEEPRDLADVRGLGAARLALTVAAAGRHHLLLVGPPGAGKTMLAHRLPTILPPLAPDAAVEVARIHSAAGRAISTLDRTPPFVAPHHTASTPAVVGGGSARLTPGQVTLAHRGTLFLDELGEFAPSVLDALRQPLEERVVRIARQAMSLTFPADFLLVACANPCPCGTGDPECQCTPTARLRYRRRMSGPLLDRFDLRLRVRAPDPAARPGPRSAEVRAQVAVAVARQESRWAHTPWRRNAQIPAGALDALLPLTGSLADVWQAVCWERQLTGRGAARVRRVARTLADLRDAEHVDDADVLQAAELRQEVWT